jgi:hypothetical protein
MGMLSESSSSSSFLTLEAVAFLPLETASGRSSSIFGAFLAAVGTASSPAMAGGAAEGFDCNCLWWRGKMSGYIWAGLKWSWAMENNHAGTY